MIYFTIRKTPILHLFSISHSKFHTISWCCRHNISHLTTLFDGWMDGWKSLKSSSSRLDWISGFAGLIDGSLILPTRVDENRLEFFFVLKSVSKFLGHHASAAIQSYWFITRFPVHSCSSVDSIPLCDSRVTFPPFFICCLTSHVPLTFLEFPPFSKRKPWAWKINLSDGNNLSLRVQSLDLHHF